MARKVEKDEVIESTGTSVMLTNKDTRIVRADTVGTMHPRETMILRRYIGRAEREGTGLSYELTVGPAGNPIVQSDKTGKYFAIGWENILHLAALAGIDEEGEPDEAPEEKGHPAGVESGGL
jgi:hypothetical protein